VGADGRAHVEGEKGDETEAALRSGPARLGHGVIRVATRFDIPGMHHVRMSVRENRLVSVILTEADYVQAMEIEGRGWVAEEHGEIVAFAVGNALTGNVWALFVHPDHEGRGLGRALHDVMVSWLWSRGPTTLWLTTEPGTRAERFYDASGWRRAGLTSTGEVRYELSRAQA
jgi:GNAT superfamily N-acetyltransferase